MSYLSYTQSEFGNKEFMIWAPVSSRSCFCWLYRASPSLAAKNISSPSLAANQPDFSIDHLVMSTCRVFSCVVGRGCLLWPMCSLGKTLLAFALLHFVLPGQTCLLLQVSLNFLLLHSSPIYGIPYNLPSSYKFITHLVSSITPPFPIFLKKNVSHRLVSKSCHKKSSPTRQLQMREIYSPKFWGL